MTDGRMEGMADMDMAVSEGSLWQRITFIRSVGDRSRRSYCALVIIDPSTLQTMTFALNGDLQLARRNEMTHRRIYCPTPR
jgi:hypothetical protein